MTSTGPRMPENVSATLARRQRNGVAVICSAHINAVGIARSLREVGWTGPVICLTTQPGSALAARWPAIARTMELDIRDPAELPGWLASRLGTAELRAVFFTDERFLASFSDDSTREILPVATAHVGSVPHLDDILDRRRFYTFLRQRELVPTPSTLASDVDPWSVFPDGFRIRVWRSWDGMRKLPRGVNVRTRADYARWLEAADRAGLDASEWGFQRLLSTAVQDCVSVSGWHDPEFQFYLNTKRLKIRNDNGWIIEATPDVHGLQPVVAAILDHLSYGGPFEVEFVRDPGSGRFHVIELNPRFWMQHRLVASCSDNCLVRRYLGWPIDASLCRADTQRRWLATDIALARLLSKDAPSVVRSMRAAVWSCPPSGSIGPAIQTTFKRWWRSTLAALRSSKTLAYERSHALVEPDRR